MIKPSQQLRLIVTIVERGKGNKVRRLYQEHQVFTHIHCEGVGTATSEILDILGIGSSEKDVLLSLTPQSAARALFSKLSDELHGAIRARGIAFILPMDAVSNRLSAVILAKTKLEKENGGDDVQQTKNSLILAIVNRGATGAVMETAKRAGARGGTIVKARWSGDEQLDRSFGEGWQTEKELLLIVSPRELRQPILEAIHAQNGAQTEAGAILCSLPIEDLVHID